MNTFSMNQLERYPIYLKYFKELQNEGIETISSPKIAAKLGYSEEQVRKDLQNVSLEPGRPKKGRSVRQLVDDIETFLGYRDSTSAVLVGCGHLGSALLNFPAFQEMGLEIIAGFDTNVDLIGKEVAGKKIFSLDSMSEILPRLNAHIVIIAVPASAAQNVADMAIKAGAKGIWNFAPAHIDVPGNVVIENVNLASSLAVLSHRLNQVLANEEKK